MLVIKVYTSMHRFLFSISFDFISSIDHFSDDDYLKSLTQAINGCLYSLSGYKTYTPSDVRQMIISAKIRRDLKENEIVITIPCPCSPCYGW